MKYATLLLIAGTAFAQPASIEFKSMCDASGAVWIDGKLLIVNDEDQNTTLLRLFDPNSGGKPVAAPVLPTSAIQFDSNEPEIDLEAITQIGATYWTIGSHSRNKSGVARWTRQNLIAFEWKSNAPVNMRSITSLLPAIGILARAADKNLKNIDPAVDPKDGGISIEGLAATPEGDLLIGLRSPLDSQERALIARLTKPSDAIKENRALPHLTKIHQLPLEGAGVRDLIHDAPANRFLILSGPAGEGGPFRIWAWKGDQSAPTKLLDVTALGKAGSPEAIVRTADKKAFWLIMDEGAAMRNGTACKDLRTEQQSFHAVRFQLP